MSDLKNAKVVGVNAKRIISAHVPVWLTCSCGATSFEIGFANSEGWMLAAKCNGCLEVSLIPREPPPEVAMAMLGGGFDPTKC